MKRVFRLANDNRMTIVAHMHANIDNSRPYGAEQARVFLEQLLPLAKDVHVQIAHLAGAGGAANPRADSALAVFADAIERGDPRMKNVWFDVSAVIDRRITPANAAKVAGQIRRLGVGRILYGTDAVSVRLLRATAGPPSARFPSPRPSSRPLPRTCRPTCARVTAETQHVSIALPSA
jgi:hypothetical protein